MKRDCSNHTSPLFPGSPGARAAFAAKPVLDRLPPAPRGAGAQPGSRRLLVRRNNDASDAARCSE